MERLKILLVEDDKMLCTIFEMFITQMGHDLIGIYQDAESALEKSKEEKPDIAILDIHIGGALNGIEAATILQREYNIPIIFLSGDADDEILNKADEIKCKIFIEKPVYKSTLNIGVKYAFLKNCFSSTDTRKSINELFLLIDNLNEPALIMKETKIININNKALDLLKFTSRDSIIGKDISEIVADENKTDFENIYLRLSKHRLLLEYFKISLKNNENEYIKLGATLSFIQNIDEDIAILNIDKI